MFSSAFAFPLNLYSDFFREHQYGLSTQTFSACEYRKLHPGWLEEIIFFDHPSGYARIRMAMQFKAQQGQYERSSRDRVR